MARDAFINKLLELSAYGLAGYGDEIEAAMIDRHVVVMQLFDRLRNVAREVYNFRNRIRALTGDRKLWIIEHSYDDGFDCYPYFGKQEPNRKEMIQAIFQAHSNRIVDSDEPLTPTGPYDLPVDSTDLIRLVILLVTEYNLGQDYGDTIAEIHAELHRLEFDIDHYIEEARSIYHAE